MTASLTTVAELEDAVGGRPPTHHLKSIADLDEHCRAILAASPFAVVAAASGDGSISMAPLGGAPGVLAVAGPTRLDLADLSGLDVPDGTAAGVLAAVPGYGETLRVNGRLRTGATPHLEVEEAFLHCAKAVIRSRLWDPPAPDPPTSDRSAPVEATGLADPEISAFLARSPFVLLGSVDAGGNADVSPKGDPAGFVQVIDDTTLAVPDRPGNRRTDTLHNLLDRPELGLLALVPGDHRMLQVRGRAHVTADAALCAGMEVNGKVPKAAVVIDVDHADLLVAPALAAASLWDPSRHVAPGTLPKATKVWVDHVKRNDDPGIAAKAARKLVNEPMMTKGIDHDYRTNLY